ncbi:PH domain-containing protein [Bacteroides caecigallinarum]|uniref:PH domain-containing protein n=1 Tax=Bacteroides caecigallinarum TaxID=1411144 RepID=UPI00195C05BF|nr:PH domain-containing protein [Bacteroides caecigallinarum]MBM6883765.1 PH domain-containing protein [Bacteroides caecigallinarum]MBM6891011.1 PH domain-containing protein [Bacteroides caecigallinarum]MCF2552207.1 PH domain-containing protein [Bacteroides caecigallinarum]
MDRTFKTEVGWWYWILISVTSLLLFYFFWMHDILLALIMAVLVIYEIEMLIHTQYVITDAGTLKIETGRFVKSFLLRIDQIESIRLVRSMVFWAPALSFYRLEIKYNGNNKTIKVHISPRNREAFISKLKSMNEKLIIIE